MIVSIIIPTYNRFVFLLQAVNSILVQQGLEDIELEIIVVDDCSTEPQYTSSLASLLATISKNAKNKNTIKLIRNEENFRAKYKCNHAQGLTRNVGLKECTGEWIGFLDDDDFWLPTKLKKQLDVLLLNDYNEKVKMCSTNAYIGYGLGRSGTYNQVYFKTKLGEIVKDGVGLFTLEYIKGCNYIMNSSMLMHSSLLQLAGYQKAEVYEDYEYWKRCMEFTDCYYLEEPLIGYDWNHGFGKQYSNT